MAILLCATIVLLLAQGVAQAQVPVPGQGATPPRPKERPVTLPVFEFHSGFWLNLHHFLYQQARLRSERPTTQEAPAPTAPAPAPAQQPASGVVSTESLSPEEQQAWSAALDYYATLAGRDLLFDSEMVNIKNRLAEMEDAPDMQKSGLRQPMIDALEAAAPVYRAHWWPAHDRANRAWVTAVGPLVKKLGTPLAERLAAVYQANWPAGPIRVDVSNYAGRVGGYTTLDPLYVTLASSDPRNLGDAAVEVLFHEASHGLAWRVAAAIARECRLRNKPIPRELWHAVLFYTTGEMVRRALAAGAEGVGGAYQPYAYRHGLYARGWQNFQVLLETHWQPYLDGRTDFDRAIARMVNAL